MTAKRLKRPRDPVQLGKLLGDILTGQVEDRAPTPQEEGKDIAAVNRGKARAKSLTPKQRSEIARVAAEARWKKSGD
jgi:hypothetical protein